MPDSTLTIIGNLTREPELRFTNTGKAVAHLSVAVNRRYQQGGEWKSDASFFEVRAWGELGENICSTLSQGNRVVVTGRLEQRSWEAEDGTKRSTIEIVADDVAPSLRFATAEVTRTEATRSTASGPAPSGATAADDESPF